MKYKPINNYETTDDLFKQLGYRFRKPKIGSLGWALINASKEIAEFKWLKPHINKMFKNMDERRRLQKEREKQNEQSKRDLSRNAA